VGGEGDWCYGEVEDERILSGTKKWCTCRKGSENEWICGVADIQSF
jgi:hypothetical protein